MSDEPIDDPFEPHVGRVIMRDGGRYEFFGANTPGDLHFTGPDGPVLTITGKGVLQFGEGVGPKEAAEAIAEGLRHYVAALNPATTYQARVQPWMLACFGPAIAADRVERNHRFLEEAIELVQACGGDRREAHQLVDYVFDRPVGEKRQEMGGVMVTLAALCLAHDLDMHEAGEAELARIWTKVEQIRAKHAAKPKGSPLPGAAPASTDTDPTAARLTEEAEAFLRRRATVAARSEGAA